MCVCVGGLGRLLIGKEKELSSMSPYTDDGSDHLVRAAEQEKAEAKAQATACK